MKVTLLYTLPIFILSSVNFANHTFYLLNKFNQSFWIDLYTCCVPCDGQNVGAPIHFDLVIDRTWRHVNNIMRWYPAAQLSYFSISPRLLAHITKKKNVRWVFFPKWRAVFLKDCLISHLEIICFKDFMRLYLFGNILWLYKKRIKWQTVTKLWNFKRKLSIFEISLSF